MKTLTHALSAVTAAALLAAYATPGSAATITSFAALDAATPTGSITAGDNAGSPPAGASDKSDFTFDFTMTTPGTLSGDHVVVEFGGGFSGTSLRLEGDRLVFRSGGTGPGTMLYVTSTALSTSSSYRVTGSLFMNPATGNDEMRLYLDGADAVDTAAANHTPAVDMGGDWTGGNAYGYGEVGGGDYLLGTPASPSGTGFAIALDATLTSDLDYYGDTFLDATTVIPEPGSLALLGLGGLCLLRTRKA